MEAVLENISINYLQNSIKKIENIREVTDIHIWSLSEEILAIIAHAPVNNKDVITCDGILHKIQHLLKEEFR